MTRFAPNDEPGWKMAFQASMDALNDADMNIRDIDAVVLSSTDSRSNGDRQRMLNTVLNSVFKVRIPIIRVPAVCAGGGVALWTANKLDFNNVLVIGAEKLVANSTEVTTNNIMMAAERIYEQSEGLNFPAQNALAAQAYMRRYSATIDDLSLVALKNHNNAFYNQKAAFYKRKVTLKQINKSPIIVIISL